MRNFKRTLALVLAVIMVVGTFATVSAASTTAKWYDKAVEMLDNAGISNIGKTAAEPLSRNEFVMWIAKIESLQLEEDAWNDEIASVVFTDVTDAHHKAAIAYSYKANFIIGNGDGTFAPDKQLSLAEASAVIVRLMRYESKVTGLAEEWDMNYMRAAAIYCNAFDQIFYKQTGTFHPDYLLTKGETAYILATILNFVKDGSYNEIIKTADGIDLGARFEGMAPAAKENVYYIASIDRVSAGTANTNTGVSEKAASKVAGNRVEMYTNVIDVTKNVVLVSADGTKVVNVPGKEFVKALRVSLGMAPTPDTMNEESEINVFEYVNHGTLVNVKLADSVVFVGNEATITNYKELTGFATNSNSVVVDTVLQYGLSNDERFVGYGAAALGNDGNVTNWKPVMNASYDATMATSWTNITYDATTGAVASATLNFKGVAYEYGSDIVAYDVNWVPMTADVAVKAIINAAQGEMYAVFNDVDADGLYDTIYVKESYAFAYADEANVQPTGPKADNSKSDKYKFDILTSTSNGVPVANAYLAYNNAGSVIFNRTVGYPNSGGMMSSDSYNLTAANTGKLQLVLCAANARPVWSNDNCVPLYYTVVDLASFYTGIIQEVSANYVDGYYTARILCTDDIIRTVYIPVEASDSCELDVTIAGATATYTFDSTGWFTFLKDTQAAAEANGIAKPENQVDPAYTTWAASWMAGKYVEFSINENNEVICILGTDASTGTTGFVTGVEKTETGDNTYNVTIATTASVTYDYTSKYFVGYTNYYNASNPLTDAEIGSHRYATSSLPHAIDANTSIVADDGKTYYKTNGHFYASTDTLTADTYFVVLDATTGKIYKNAAGNYTDKNGNAFIDAIAATAYKAVSAVKTTEVRAAASGIFDWANYNVYNQLFAGSLIDPNTTSDAKVDAGKDLIYVTLYKDAGSNYVLYNKYPSTNVSNTTTKATQFQVNGASYTSNRWYKVTNSVTYTVEGSWIDVLDGHIIDYKKVQDLGEFEYANGVKYKSALYDMTVGYGPYYDRTWDAAKKTYTYEIGFTTVKTMTGVIGTEDAIVDTVNSLLIPIYTYTTGSASVHLQLTKAEDIAAYEKNGYFVDEFGFVFKFVDGSMSIQYKKDANGNILYKDVVYDDAKATLVKEETDVLFKNILNDKGEQAVYPYGNLSLTAKTSKDEGYFPGAYYLNLDGVKYNVNANTQFVVVTPSAKGFNIDVKTLAEMANEDPFFVTEWNAVIGAGNTIGAIAIVGEKATVGGNTTTDPDTPVVDDKTTLVYLDADAKAFIRHDKYSNAWLVVSDKTAYALPTGEEVGAIYRSYPTYADADNAIKIDLGIEGGKWYLVDESGKIVSDADIKLLTGTVTDIKADGTTIATMNGVKNQVISTMKTEFFYFDAEGKTLNVAGDNTNVSIISKQAFNDLFKSYRTAVAEADAALYGYVAVTSGGTHKIDISTGRIVPMETGDAAALGVYNYDVVKGAQYKYEQGNLSDERYAYYVEKLEDAQKALADAKASNLDKYFNGQFWGFANSPLYKYVAMSHDVFQQDMPTLYFKYVIVDDTLCVFSDKFAFTQAEADAMN